ncbi:hypothetical protein J6590_052057 [Homalodisca vitripennis]|nr:hypothetical protein J6590_052057 [Homalodisca vitripennis]
MLKQPLLHPHSVLNKNNLGFSRVKAGDMASGVGPIESDVVPAEDEELGDFLLLTDRLYDCFFVVGNADQGPTERIGAVKACLMNQSRVFRNMLHDSQLAERGDIMVPDIQPPVFRLLLKYICSSIILFTHTHTIS